MVHLLQDIEQPCWLVVLCLQFCGDHGSFQKFDFIFLDALWTSLLLSAIQAAGRYNHLKYDHLLHCIRHICRYKQLRAQNFTIDARIWQSLSPSGVAPVDGQLKTIKNCYLVASGKISSKCITEALQIWLMIRTLLKDDCCLSEAH